VKPAAAVAAFVGVGVVVLLTAAGGGSPVVGVQRVGDRMKGQLGRFFSWAEVTASGAASRLGLDNTPPPEAQAALERLVAVVLDPLRSQLGRPIVVTSGYRSAAVNRAVSGSPTSQHMSGEAVDIKATGLSAEQLAGAIVRTGLPFDQVIWYAPERGGHVHLSYTEKRPNRWEVLYAPPAGGYTPSAAS
jgi:zinc D-Ala-D-Ala carboxypeptidase